MTGRQWTEADIRALGVRTDLETAAEVWGMGRTKAYELARAGDFPSHVLRVGGRWVVPVAPLLQALGLGPERTETAPSQDAVAATDSRAIIPGALHEAWPAQPPQSNVRALPPR